jgi:hypothetical protein
LHGFARFCTVFYNAPVAAKHAKHMKKRSLNPSQNSD